MKKKKKNVAMIFNVLYGMSFMALYLPKFFFPNGFYQRSSLIWQLLFTTTAFSFYDSHPLAILIYGMMFTVIMVSYLLMFTKEMKLLSKATIFLVYCLLNVGINIIISNN